ncbi:NADP(H)-dependent aldo-keto reductase [Novispirillum sp. DQ9]|uniref:NADP(H)-dependent aldo-keto reductase n=1 Tax=Novispirillum sp. DQ9 TaxID=3398612 RepID=UPI003C7EAF01
MQYRPLGRTGLSVSAISLGTMTYGEQNSEAEAHAFMDRAVDAGVNFFDAAELYPISPRPETQGRTEEYIGSWLKARGRRDAVILATKVVARSPAMPWFRGADHVMDRANIAAAVDASLKRLGTDVIDLYYLHWPDRRTNYFGQLGYRHDPDDTGGAPLEESLAALQEQIQAGKIRHVGLSNETPWGVHRALLLAETRGLPRPACIQNPYSLLNRTFETGLAEMAIREDVPLVAYSPLAGGVLSGKYRNGARPEGARITLWPARYSRYTKPRALPAVDQYVTLAAAVGLDPARMALAYTLSRPFLASSIMGATTLEQLENNLAAADLTLTPDVVAAIDAIHARDPDPAP